MPINERTFDSAKHLHETELEELKLMFESGTPLAVTAAMDYSNRHRWTSPPWAVAESVKMLCTLLRGETPQKRGRSNGIADRYRQDAIDFVRWEAVVEVRENRKILRDKIQALMKLPGNAARERRAYCEKLLRWATKDSFKCASMLLVESPAFGGRDAVRISFRKVQRNLRNRATAMRYHILDREFLRKIGCLDPATPRPGKKVVHLFDLKN